MRFKIPKLNVFGELAGLGMPHNFIYLLYITFIRIPSLEVVPSRFLTVPPCQSLMLRDIFVVISYATGKEQITVLIIYTNSDLFPPPYTCRPDHVGNIHIFRQ